LHSLEERVLLPDLSALTEALLHTIDRTPPPANSEAWRAARKLALSYLGVAQRALRPDVELPRDVDAAAVAEALAALRQGSGAALARAEPSGPNLARLTDPSRLRALQLELVKQTPARDTREEPVQATTPAGLFARLGATAGFRLFGRRFVPDSHVFDRLVYPH